MQMDLADRPAVSRLVPLALWLFLLSSFPFLLVIPQIFGMRWLNVAVFFPQLCWTILLVAARVLKLATKLLKLLPRYLVSFLAFSSIT